MASHYLELTKPRILMMVLITTAMGFFFGERGIHSIALFILTLTGTGLAAAGASALNQYLERDEDAKMERTANRPIPAGRILPLHALGFGILLVLAGVVLLAGTVNLITAFLVLLTALLYVLVYTPLKKITWLNTSIGAVPGAIPPLAGWAGATGHIDPASWILFWILFLWQHPHFFAIAWMYKDEYQKAGFKMLPVVEPDGVRMFRQIIWHSLILIPVSLMPTLVGMAGIVYFWGALVLGLFYFLASVSFTRTKSVPDARRLLRASVIYLPVLLLLVIFNSCVKAPVAEPLPVLSEVPAFELTDSGGKPFSREQLKGKVWVADFIFTTCAGPCPIMSKNLAGIQRSYLLEQGIDFVSVSVNPEYDSPAVLTEYARRFKADTGRWHFLTGPREKIQDLALTGFKIGSKENPIFHSTFFILVDGNFNIRGYYEGTNKEKIRQLFKDIARLKS